LNEDEAERPEQYLREDGPGTSAEFQQDARKHVHSRREGMKVVDRFQETISEIGWIAQPHPIEAEVETEAEFEQEQTTEDEEHRDECVLAPASQGGRRFFAHASAGL
jgi:hypothetical protein